MKKLEKLSDSKFQTMEATKAKLIFGGQGQATLGGTSTTPQCVVTWKSDCTDSEGEHHYGVTMTWVA